MKDVLWLQAGIVAVYLLMISVLSLTGRALFRSRRMKYARDQILDYLKEARSNTISFKKIRRLGGKRSEKYDDKFLAEVIEYFPNDFRATLLEDGDGTSLGLESVSREGPFRQSRNDEKLAVDKG
jgi:hypothetical protein